MRSKTRLVLSFTLFLLLGAGLGCAKKPDDGKISSDIQTRFSQDSGLSSKQLGIESANGVVTISGSVDNDAQREAAGRQAASVAGVKTVINNLQVGAQDSGPVAASASSVAPVPPPTVAPAPGTKGKPSASKKSRKSRPADETSPANSSDSDANGGQMTASNQTPPPPPASAPGIDSTPAVATPPPPPVPKKLIIDQGTQLTVRLIDPIDSEKNQTGDTFRATLNAPLTADGEEAVPAGVELTGHLVEVKSAGKFAGQSMIAMQLDSLATGGRTYNLQTDQYKKAAASRGKNTAEKVGGGAVIGTIIGAIAGGGKGAAIGGAAGAGVGGGVQAASKSQQVKLPSETILNFTLQAPVTVTQGPKPDANRPKLTDSQ